MFFLFERANIRKIMKLNILEFILGDNKYPYKNVKKLIIHLNNQMQVNMERQKVSWTCVIMPAVFFTCVFFYNNATAQTITIGAQNWCTKNLDVSTYRNGDTIPQVQDATQWSDLKTGAWCYYENQTKNGSFYGKLYNWYAVKDARGLAPKGYHIPSDAEWTNLTDYLGGENEAGSKMKSTVGWNENIPNSFNGTNSSGFTGLPGGYRTNDGTFSDIGNNGSWWSSTQAITYIAWFRNLSYTYGFVFRSSYYEKNGFSVRCLED